MLLSYLLYDIGAEFLNRQCANIACELTNDAITESLIVEIKDVLNDVIPVRILNESQCVECNLVDELLALHFRRMVNAPLKDTTSVTVSGNFDTVGSNGIVYEL